MNYRFNSHKFANDVIACVERIGWDTFRTNAKTTDKVMARAMMFCQGTISAQTVAKFCNVMNRSPLVYFSPKEEN